jgi:GNAT superfamily N-acetyltransferase
MSLLLLRGSQYRPAGGPAAPVPWIDIECRGLASPEAVACIEAGSRAYNADLMPRNEAPLHLVVRSDCCEVVAGLLATTRWRMLEISSLWVRDELRCLGLGGRLLHEAEALARRRGCAWAAADGFSFQSIGFFARAGYHAYAVLPGYSMNQARHLMRKRL